IEPCPLYRLKPDIASSPRQGLLRAKTGCERSQQSSLIRSPRRRGRAAWAECQCRLAVCRLMTNSNLGTGTGRRIEVSTGVGSEPSVGQPGSLQRARPAVEVALTPKRQQLGQVRQAQFWIGRAHFGDQPPALLGPAGENVTRCRDPAGGEIVGTDSQGGRCRMRRVVVSPSKEECIGARGVDLEDEMLLRAQLPGAEQALAGELRLASDQHGPAAHVP